MTNDEAIEIIECGEISNRWGKDGEEVEKMAIKALKQEPCEDCVSALNRVMEYTYGMLTAEKAGLQHLIKSMLDDLPSVNPQPCEPVRNPDQLDCVSRQAVLDTLENMDRALDEDRTVENYKELLRECYKVLPSVNPQKPICPSAGVDCEDCPAYEKKPNINAVLDKIRAEIDEQYDRVHPYDISCAEGLEMALNIVDKYKAEGSEE